MVDVFTNSSSGRCDAVYCDFVLMSEIIDGLILIVKILRRLLRARV